DPLGMAEKSGVEIMNFSGDVAMLLGKIPLHHKDSFDRIIIAQAIANGLPVMTDDPKFLEYECKIV
ncbi:MAG: type II toxin-antitoxin system VapC family toxin, partial [Desulfobacteraceae bacterium]|nr:type II toxin-antitoxin system VapC family toxin [Desulfobacteraceae bacterium]